MTGVAESATAAGGREKGDLIKRHTLLRRLTHWVWVIAVLFLIGSGLNIFGAHPKLYIGQESGFEYNNTVLAIGAKQGTMGPEGVTTILGQSFNTTGFLGLSGGTGRAEPVAFPSWLTIPSFRDLATARVIHFFFAWVLSGTLLLWLADAVMSGHFRNLVLGPKTWRALPGDIGQHLRFRFPKSRGYSPLQKLSYVLVLGVLMPLLILTGLAMSPGMNAAWPWLLDVFGGRQTARTIHFLAMALMVLFVLIHVLMVVVAGPFNHMRAMITGRFRIDRDTAS